jgi:hypothetical protein
MQQLHSYWLLPTVLLVGIKNLSMARTHAKDWPPWQTYTQTLK